MLCSISGPPRITGSGWLSCYAWRSGAWKRVKEALWKHVPNRRESLRLLCDRLDRTDYAWPHRLLGLLRLLLLECRETSQHRSQLNAKHDARITSQITDGLNRPPAFPRPSRDRDAVTDGHHCEPLNHEMPDSWTGNLWPASTRGATRKKLDTETRGKGAGDFSRGGIGGGGGDGLWGLRRGSLGLFYEIVCFLLRIICENNEFVLL